MIQRPPGMGAFQFVVLASLRAAQLTRGCLPRVDGLHKVTVTAQVEVAEGKVMQLVAGSAGIGEAAIMNNAFVEGLVAVGSRA